MHLNCANEIGLIAPHIKKSQQVKIKKCGKKVTSCVMRESKQKCVNFTVIAGNLEGL
jgi:hypothetical protein